MVARTGPQEAVNERREARRQLRARIFGSKECWVAAKQRAAKLERETFGAHFRQFVETELNRPTSLGRTTRLVKRWKGQYHHRPGEALATEDSRRLVADREKADAFNLTYAQVARQIRAPKLDREVQRKTAALTSSTGRDCCECSGESTEACVPFSEEELNQQFTAAA